MDILKQLNKKKARKKWNYADTKQTAMADSKQLAVLVSVGLVDRSTEKAEGLIEGGTRGRSSYVYRISTTGRDFISWLDGKEHTSYTEEKAQGSEEVEVELEEIDDNGF